MEKTKPIAGDAGNRDIPQHIQILHAIKNICLKSQEPYQTVSLCLAFVNSLILQAESENHAKREKARVTS